MSVIYFQYTQIDADEDTIKEIAQHALDGNFLNYCAPMPKAIKEAGKLGDRKYWDWINENWGDRDDFESTEFICNNDDEGNKGDYQVGRLRVKDSKDYKGLKMLRFAVNANSPTIGAYNNLLKKKPKLKLISTYYCSNNDDCGVYDNGEHRNRDGIPSSKDKFWNTIDGKLLEDTIGLLDVVINEEQNAEE